jgi:hypothetical protein
VIIDGACLQAYAASGRSDIQSVIARDDGSGLDIERMPVAVAENDTLARNSGGPVFVFQGDGVLAKGIISGGIGSKLLFSAWENVIKVYNGYPVTPP